MFKQIKKKLKLTPMFRQIELKKIKLKSLSRILNQNTSRTNKFVLDARNKYKIKKDKFVEEHGGKTLKEIAEKFYDNDLNEKHKLNLKEMYNAKLNFKDNNITYFNFLPYSYNTHIEEYRRKVENYMSCVSMIDGFFSTPTCRLVVKKFLLSYNDNMHIIPLIVVKKNNKNYIIINYNDVDKWGGNFLYPCLEDIDKNKNNKNNKINIIILPLIQHDNKTCYVSAYETIKHLKDNDIDNIISYFDRNKNLLKQDKQTLKLDNFSLEQIAKNTRIENVYYTPYDLLPPKLLQYAQTGKVFQNEELMKKEGLKEKIDPFLENIVDPLNTEKKIQNGKLSYRLVRFFDKYKDKIKEEETRKQQQKEKNNETQKKNKLKLALDVREKMEQNEEKNNHSIPIISPLYKIHSLHSKIPSLRFKMLYPRSKIHSKIPSLRSKMHSNILSPRSKMLSPRYNIPSLCSKMHSNILSPCSNTLSPRSNISTLSKQVNNNTFQI